MKGVELYGRVRYAVQHHAMDGARPRETRRAG